MCSQHLLSISVCMNVDFAIIYEEGLQRSCGACLACMDEFAKSYPEEFVHSQKDHLMKQILGFFGKALCMMSELKHRSHVEHNKGASYHCYCC